MSPIRLPVPPEASADRQRRLGRLVAQDNRDLRFALHAARPDLLPPPNAVLPVQRIHLPPPVMNQGATSSCVGHAVVARLQGHPVPMQPEGRRGRRVLPWDPFEVYAAAQQVDEWPGAEPAYYGTSVRAGLKVGQAAGLVVSYHTVLTVADMRRYVLWGRGGGLVVGTDWKSGMWDTDPEGFVRYRGATEGGHAWYVYGASERRQAFRAQNSWGPAWGDKGRFWFAYADMELALADWADVYAVLEVGQPGAQGVAEDQR